MPPLSADAIVAATIDIIRTEGLAKATMRRVGQVLDTGAASLYVYFANTAELHSAVLDELTSGFADDADAPWRERLVTLLENYADVLFRYPGLARSALVLRPMGPNTIGVVGRILGLLIEGGAPADRAAWGVDLLMLTVTASAAEHSAPTPSDVDPRSSTDKLSALETSLRSADAAAAPYVSAHVDRLMSGDPTSRMRWALEATIEGILVTPVPRDAEASA